MMLHLEHTVTKNGLAKTGDGFYREIIYSYDNN